MVGADDGHIGGQRQRCDIGMPEHAFDGLVLGVDGHDGPSNPPLAGQRWNYSTMLASGLEHCIIIKSEYD